MSDGAVGGFPGQLEAVLPVRDLFPAAGQGQARRTRVATDASESRDGVGESGSERNEKASALHRFAMRRRPQRHLLPR